MAVVPEALMTRFRGVAMQRLERIDSAWAALARGEAEGDAEKDLLRDVHTLKGDARVVGLQEVSLLCQRLEDLLEAARVKGYRVHDDVDIVVTMAIQFIGMLVRKQSSARSGIDFDGFMKQVEEVMSEWLRRSSEAPLSRVSVGPHLRVKDHQSISSSSGIRLSSSTTSVFLEQLRCSGEARDRIRELWEQLLAGVMEAHSAPLTATIVSHIAAARELAEAQRKRVHIEISGDGISVTPETAEVIGVFLVHALNNAIDHGIELPLARTQAGKSAVAELTIRIRREADAVLVAVSDDGGGVDVERVRQRAVQRGLISADVAPDAPEEQILEYIFSPGFSTREASTNISGRGIGLDAAQAAVRRHGGSLAIASRAGGGTTITAKVLDVRGGIDVTCFDGGSSDTRFAVPSKYGVRRTELPATVIPEDLVRATKVRKPNAEALEIFDERTKIVVLAGSSPSTHHALRRCPTRDNDLVEIVWVDGVEVVMLRPEVVP